MLYSQAREKTIMLLNQFSNAGNLIPSTDGNTVDFTLRMPALLDFSQKEIATTAKFIHKVTHISQNPIPNLLSNADREFDVRPYQVVDITDAQVQGAQSYYFEVDGVATIYIEEETDPINQIWTILSTINNTTTGQFTAYSGFTGIQNIADNIRIRFSGLYPYNYRNRALYAYLFPTAAAVPPYTKFINYAMGQDFFKLQKVEIEKNDTPFPEIVPWQWEGRDVLAVNYYYAGSIDIFYYAYPATINDTVPDSYVFEIDEEACQAMPFYVASQLLIDDEINKSVSARLYDMYQGKLANLENVITQGDKSVKNTMFSSSSNKLFSTGRNRLF